MSDRDYTAGAPAHLSEFLRDAWAVRAEKLDGLIALGFKPTEDFVPNYTADVVAAARERFDRLRQGRM